MVDKTMLFFRVLRRTLCTKNTEKLEIDKKIFERDDFTNVSKRLLELLDRKLYLRDDHPLRFMKERIVKYFYDNFKGRTGNSIFSVYEQLDPIVTTYQNFDSLLIPSDHVSRTKTDCYYINRNYLLRSHMTAHQSELIKMGLSTFLMVGDVYRRDEIDRNHYPVFHQLDGVRLFTPEQIFYKEDDGSRELAVLRKEGAIERNNDCQEFYTTEASKRVEEDLKRTLEGLCRVLFGKGIVFRWTESYFPFTHPSWELEIMINDNWMEVLGCGITEYNILKEAGCENRIGWAFGLGLERLAMILYAIPDIRTFWSQDPGFLCQFSGKSFMDKIIYKPVGSYPPCKNHISFWIPDSYSSNDFYDLIRQIGGDLVEQVHLIDVYENKKNNRTSHCYEIIYRHPEKTFTQTEVNSIHNKICVQASSVLNVTVR